jgi:hypothetical protein
MVPTRASPDWAVCGYRRALRKWSAAGVSKTGFRLSVLLSVPPKFGALVCVIGLLPTPSPGASPAVLVFHGSFLLALVGCSVTGGVFSCRLKGG